MSVNYDPTPTEGIMMTTSWYGHELQGQKMANGERFDCRQMIVAHKELPLGTGLIIINPENGAKVRATVKDRGPYVANRCLDVSAGVAKKLGLKMGKKGTAPVQVHVLTEPSWGQQRVVVA